MSKLDDMTSVELYEWRSKPFKDEIANLRADNERLRALVKDLADDLEEELRGHYALSLHYPSQQRRFDRDMHNVYEARRALEPKP